MKKLKRIIYKFIKSISLIDKALLLLMFLLLFQTVHELFFIEIQNQLSSSVDVVFRTAIASIFGYFVSSNFLRNAGVEIIEKDPNPGEANSVYTPQQVVKDEPYEDNGGLVDNITPANDIVMTDSSSTASIDEPLQNNFADQTFSIPMQNDLDEKIKKSYVYKISRKNQVIVVSTIGIIVLVVLIIARDFNQINTTHIPVITQLRDIFCGALGFLLGTPADE